MKKISIDKMANIEAGLKCIYHFMALPLLGFWGLVLGNGRSVVECWNNIHQEN